MPATYRHVYTSEQMLGGHRFSWQKQEPSKPPEYRVFGIVCDKRTYYKYNRCVYDLGDGSLRNLLGVQAFAEGAELAEHFPEMAAEAKKIMARVRAEITGEEDKNMSKSRTAADFIDALNDIYTESRNVYAVLQDKVDKAAAKMERAREELRDPSCKDKRIAQLRFDLAQGEYKIAEDARLGEYKAMVTGHKKKVAELRAQFAAHLDEHYAASPDKLDTATMQLLGSGICTPTDLARLVERHQGNPTMLRIVGEYARNLREDNRRSMSKENRAICSSVAQAGFSAKDGSRELAIFDSAASATKYGLDKNYDHATRMDSHIAGWFDGFRSQMENLPNVPAEMDSGSGGGEE